LILPRQGKQQLAVSILPRLQRQTQQAEREPGVLFLSRQEKQQAAVTSLPQSRRQSQARQTGHTPLPRQQFRSR
jgi:hypothetical protein